MSISWCALGSRTAVPNHAQRVGRDTRKVALDGVASPVALAVLIRHVGFGVDTGDERGRGRDIAGLRCVFDGKIRVLEQGALLFFVFLRCFLLLLVRFRWAFSCAFSCFFWYW
jgi:hypothetical protein